jgi:O-antigen ligase
MPELIGLGTFLFAMVGGVIGLMRPRVGLAFFMALVPWDAYISIGGRSAIFYIFPLVFFGALMRRRIKIFRVHLIFIVLLAWYLVSLLVTGVSSSGLYKFSMQVNMLLMLVLFVSLVVDLDSFERISHYFLISTALLAMTFIVGYLIPQLGLINVSFGRTSLAGARMGNKMGHLFVISIFWVILLPALNPQVFGKWFRPAILLPFYGIGILMIGSKTSLLAVAVGLGVLLFDPRYRTRNVIRIISVAWVLGATWYIAQSYFPDLALMSRLADLSENPTVATTGRFDIFMVGLNVFADNWFFGVGLGEFPVNFIRYASVSAMYHYKMVAADPHNTYLAVLAETGLPGLMLFSWLCITLFKGNLKNGWRSSIEIVALASALFLVSSSSTHIAAKFFWLTLGLIYVAKRIRHRQRLFQQGLNAEDVEETGPVSLVHEGGKNIGATLPGLSSES